MHLRKLLISLLLAGATVACQKGTVADLPAEEGFESVPVMKPLTPGVLDEASGIADSKTNPGYLWVQQDSGNPNEIALLSHDGVFLKTIKIASVDNHDWEDMVVANGPVAGAHYIYLAETGDNDRLSAQHAIYRFAEPTAADTGVLECDKIVFEYPDGAHDAEALLVDKATKDIYIITKRDVSSRIYKIAYPQHTSLVNEAVLSGSLSFNGVTSAALSPDGKEVLIKTYDKIYYWKNNNGQTIPQLLAEAPVALSHQLEPQGEAICFKNDNSGFFTLSERPVIVPAVTLNFYKRK